MKKNRLEITEGDLHAYVDNQLSADKIEAIETLMHEDPKIAQQVQEWQQQNSVINELFNKKASTEAPEKFNLKHLVEKQSRTKEENIAGKIQKSPWHYSMAASLFLMLMSGTAGWFANDLSQPQTMTTNTTNFVNSAISAHQVYSVEVLHPVEVNADKQIHMVTWLSKRIGHPLTVPNLKNYGYKLLGGRLLSMREGRSAAQIMFENKEGKRITLLVSKNPIYRDQAFHLKSDNNINAYYWMDSNVAYSITGEMNSDTLRKLSKSVYEQLSEKRITKTTIASTQF